MSGEVQSVFLGELHCLVGIIPEISVFFGMYLFAFHTVLSHDGIELFLH
jgi:hypothetical protein